MTASIKDNAIEPTEAQLEALKNIASEGPVHFINFLKYKKTADYPADHPLAKESLSGEDAYNAYGAVAVAQVMKRGGRLVTLNAVQQQLIGESGSWDLVATMEYQKVQDFLDMVEDTEYEQALVHRDAGLEATELFVTRPLINEPIG